MRWTGSLRRWLMAGCLLAGSMWPAGAQAQRLTVADVQQIVSAAVQEANARGQPATIAVVDRVGNVLAVFQMNGAPARVTITSKREIPVGNGLENVQQTFAALGAANSPSTPLAAIAKAVTGAYLSSGGNAFTTRTASQIVQEHFNPGEAFSPSGPLFGVQFTQLPCSDLSVRQETNSAVTGLVSLTVGPKRSPLGLSADPGGLPLYKNGAPVGGIGVESNGVYTLDLNVIDFDFDLDEVIAIAGQAGFEAPPDIQANRIFLEGKSLRFTDVNATALITDPSAAPAFATITGGVLGDLVDVSGYFDDAAVLAGQIFGTVASGIAPENTGIFAFVGRTVFVLFDGAGNPRFAPRDSITPNVAGGGLTTNEVTTIIGNALKIAFAGRAQIRRPLNSHIQVTISIVDADGNILGIARTPDGPIFGTDTSLQKARTAAFFSSPAAAAYLQGYDSSAVLGTAVGQNANGVVLQSFLTAVRGFVGPTALADGVAFSDRSGGNLSRPFYPDGIDDAGPGPFSRPFVVWSPFNTGLQLDSMIDNIVLHILFADDPANAPGALAGAVDSDATCTFFARFATNLTRLANGFQIFPGSVPIFRGNQLIGGIGVSGDGIDQDDMTSFLGLNDAGIALGTGVGNAPPGIRADNLSPVGARLRYVNCPFKPFIDSRDQNVCRGK